MSADNAIHEPSVHPSVYAENSPDMQIAAALAHHSVELVRQSRMLYDYSRPVDEYQSTPGWPAGGFMEVQPTYEAPERIDSITIGLPVGVVSAQMQLGDRFITVYQGNTVLASPAVPASTVAAQNQNSIAAQVVITGGTLTAVVVNGVTVGTAAGTYVVPAFGTIAVTYTVAPTWAWSGAGAALQIGQVFHFTDIGIILSRDDARFLQLTPAAQPPGATGGVHFELTGFADETWGMA